MESVLLPGGDVQDAPVSVEPLTDDYGIRDYRITALQAFGEALLTVCLPERSYALALSCQTAPRGRARGGGRRADGGGR